MSAPSPPAWITLAHILRPQGRKGELLADLLTDFPETLTERTTVHLLGPAANAEPHPVTIVRSWLPHGRNEGRIVLELQGVSSIAQAESLAGHQLVIPAAERIRLDDGSEYISDLIGLRLRSGKDDLGTITDVSFALSADGRRRLPEAAPLLIVHTGAGAEVLVPFVRDYLTRIDHTAGTIEMRLPAGLFDLDHTEPSS